MLGFADSFMNARRLRLAEDEALANRRWMEEQQGRQRSQWGREDAARSQLDQLAYDQQYGMAVPGTDNSYDVAEAKRFGVQAPASTLQRQPLKQSQIHGRLGQVALGLGDTKGYAQASQAQRQFEEDELIAQSMSADPDPNLARYLNGNHRSITVGEPDQYGFRPMSVVKADGSAMFMNLSQADQKKLAAANALMERNPTRALQMIGEVNKDLAQSVATEFQAQMAVGKEENDANARRLTAQHQGAALRQQGAHQSAMLAETSKHNRAMEGIGRTRAANEGARAERENAALRKLEEGGKISDEAAGYAQGLHVAKGLGDRGKEAAKIYEQHLVGANTRLRGRGLQTYEPYAKPRVDPLVRARMVQAYALAGYELPEAEMMADRELGVQAGPSLEDLASTLRDASERKRRPDQVTPGGAW